jgi:hypothetical protein
MAVLLLWLLPLTKDGNRWGYSDLLAQVLPGKAQSMDRLEIERVGGLAGFGLPGSHLRSKGTLTLSALSPADRSVVDALFDGKEKGSPGMPDGFRYRITRQTSNGPQTIEVPEDRVPTALQNCVKDELE